VVAAAVALEPELDLVLVEAEMEVEVKVPEAVQASSGELAAAVVGRQIASRCTSDQQRSHRRLAELRSSPRSSARPIRWRYRFVRR
jgi:hypothetical protein